MKKELSGAELVSFIKERQARQVRNLKQQYHVIPRLMVLMGEHATEASETYVRMKSRYAEDIGVSCEIIKTPEETLLQYIQNYNNDSNVHGIIVQLPLKNISQTDEICNTIDSNKDVDGLSSQSAFVGATAEAIDWLLAGYNVELADKHITIVGHGKLVGQPLAALWRSQGREVTVIDIDTSGEDALRNSDVIVSATGVPRRIVSADVKRDAVVVDAGTAAEHGVLVGDVDESVRQRQDVTITPLKGGVGPLTVAVLFDHVIQAALHRALDAS